MKQIPNPGIIFVRWNLDRIRLMKHSLRADRSEIDQMNTLLSVQLNHDSGFLEWRIMVRASYSKVPSIDGNRPQLTA